MIIFIHYRKKGIKPNSAFEYFESSGVVLHDPLSQCCADIQGLTVFRPSEGFATITQTPNSGLGGLVCESEYWPRGVNV